MNDLSLKNNSTHLCGPIHLTIAAYRTVNTDVTVILEVPERHMMVEIVNEKIELDNFFLKIYLRVTSKRSESKLSASPPSSDESNPHRALCSNTRTYNIDRKLDEDAI